MRYATLPASKAGAARMERELDVDRRAHFIS
jgi:hypothetical protein